jgi:N-(2-amino-2-carboxyethyl)-L-glutamate synthase
MNEGILSAIGNTPLVRLERIFPDINFKLYGKLEALNPGGSMKDRPAISIINHGLKTGDIHKGTVIVESSSGNMGIGLAQACSYYGLRFICVVDSKTSPQNIRLMELYGAEIDLVTKPDPVTGELLQTRINRVQELLNSTDSSFWPNQYSNTYNSNAHHFTMEEIVAALGHVDYVFCATSTCGTIRGCMEYVREHNLSTKVFAVDAVGSVIFGGTRAKRLIPGHGAAVRPNLYQPHLNDRCIYMTDLDCVIGCYRLARREAILAGGSSGAIMMAIDQVRDSIPRDAVCVAILPDRGERYLDTIYSESWVKQHFGDISHEGNEIKENQQCTMVTY